MAEYIKREALQAALVRKRCGVANQRYTEGWNDCLLRVKSMVSKTPSADVAPVVCCRHCRSYNKPRLGWCSVHLDRENPDDFCSYGERKEAQSDAKAD